MIEKIKSHWEEIIKYVVEEYDVGNLSYTTFLKPLKPDYIEKNSLGKNTLYICHKDEMSTQFLNLINSLYKNKIYVAIDSVLDLQLEIEFQNHTDKPKNTGNSIINQYKKNVDLSKIAKSNINHKYKFENFVVGKSNNIAHAASLATAESPGDIYNPLFLFGRPGLGKTHLMHAIGNSLLEKNPDLNILYIPSSAYMNDVVDHIKNQEIHKFREKYKSLDVLLIDDIQFISDKTRGYTQEEFFHLFNHLYEHNKQIVVSSDNPPNNLSGFEDRLTSRLGWGMIASIEEPDYETRVAILRKKEEIENINVDDEIIQYIAKNIKNNIRELESALIRIKAIHKLEKKEITMDIAKKALEHIIRPNEPEKLTNEVIIKVVTEHFGVTISKMIGKGRETEIIIPRFVAIYLCKELLDSSWVSIGDSLKKNHSSIISGYKKISKQLANDKELASSVEIIRKKLSPQ